MVKHKRLTLKRFHLLFYALSSVSAQVGQVGQAVGNAEPILVQAFNLGCHCQILSYVIKLPQLIF
jgi:hypothetical protein